MFHAIECLAQFTAGWICGRFLPDRPQSKAQPAATPQAAEAEARRGRHEQTFHNLFEAMMKVVHKFPGLSAEIDTVLAEYERKQCWN